MSGFTFAGNLTPFIWILIFCGIQYYWPYQLIIQLDRLKDVVGEHLVWPKHFITVVGNTFSSVSPVVSNCNELNNSQRYYNLTLSRALVFFG